MATPILSPTSADSVPLTFRTQVDCGHMRLSPDHEAPESFALHINPSASRESLFGAVMSRVDRLHSSLDMWARIIQADVEVHELAETLEPLAQEIAILLARLHDVEVAHG